MPLKMPSLATIAKEAGVSKTTVSMVINNKADRYGISKNTQQRIREHIARYKYVPNEYARGFRLQKTKTIGLVVPDVLNPFFAELALATENVFRRNGYDLFVASSEEKVETENAVVRNLCSRSIDGLILATTKTAEKDVEELPVPTVYIDRQINTPGAAWVVSDNYQGSFELVSHLCKKGAQEVVFVGAIQEISTNRNRLQGYRDALMVSGREIKNENIIQVAEFSTGKTYEATKKFLAGKSEPPQAIFCFAMKMFEEVLQALKEKYGAIPGSIHLATFDNHSLLDYLPVPVCRARQRTEEMARAAFEILTGTSETPNQNRQHIIKPELIFRN